MKTAFVKMHGLGNDFVVIDAMTDHIALSPDQIRFLADRHFGVGCDQLLLLEPPTSEKADVTYRIFNADGGEVEQCGNGARCVAVYLRESHGLDKQEIIAETAKGLIRLYNRPDGQVTVNMGIPRFEPADIPVCFDQRERTYKVKINDLTIEFAALSMGNPHAILEVADVDKAPVGSWGPLIESHELFPERVNVGFMQIIDRDRIRLRVHERGVGETLACGTGACAAVVAGIVNDRLDNVTSVTLPGGELQIAWAGPDQPVMMTGPVTRVFEGVIEL